jgi:DNA-binding NarL/FixJ family response regulator
VSTEVDAAYAAPEGTEAAEISARQRHILELLVQGHSDRVMAVKACVSNRTLQRELRAILNLLQARTRAQAAAEAVRRGWIPR